MLIIAPFAKTLHNGKENPKNYPYWEELIQKLVQNNVQVVQVGIEGEKQLVPDFRKNLSLDELKELITQCDKWIGVDSFFQHLAWSINKPGIVLWSVSDPLIFGHPENTNLLKSRDNLAENQFLWWDFTEHNPNYFISPEEVLKFM